MDDREAMRAALVEALDRWEGRDAGVGHGAQRERIDELRKLVAPGERAPAGVTGHQRALLVEILTETERLDKITIALDPASRTVTLTYEDIDDEWWRELAGAVSA